MRNSLLLATLSALSINLFLPTETQAHASTPSTCKAFPHDSITQWATGEEGVIQSANLLSQKLSRRLVDYEEAFSQQKLKRNVALKAESTHCGLTLSYYDQNEQLSLRWQWTAKAGADGQWLIDLPLQANTNTWKTQRIGAVTYHFENSLNTTRAQRFATKYANIAETFQQEVEAIDFYIVDDYQQFLSLVGIDFSAKYQNNRRDGYGIVANTIFSVMQDPDFSHDTVHYYAAKVHSQRNWPAEEGVAYLWGNAYYTNKQAYAADYPEMMQALLELVEDKKQQGEPIDWLRWWQDNPKAFFAETTTNAPNMAPETSIRALISAMLCEQVWQQHGIKGLKQLMNAGRGEAAFFAAIESTLGISSKNFNQRLGSIINQYRSALESAITNKALH